VERVIEAEAGCKSQSALRRRARTVRQFGQGILSELRFGGIISIGDYTLMWIRNRYAVSGG
jgi:hypothetical protein